MFFLKRNKRKAQKLHEEAQEVSDKGRDDEAIKIYLEAINLDPEKSESFYNIGLIYKYQGNWEESLNFNTKAYELNPNDESARWNVAIAATALNKWDIVRSAWKDNGIEIDGTSGPIKMNFGMAPIRLNPDSSGEVVWATRIDPVRAQIESIPYKNSGFKYRDIVLNDGAAVGHRMWNDIEYPVFNALEKLEESNYSTAIVSINLNHQSDFETLSTIFAETQNEFEDWTTNVRSICRKCSEGKPHENHDNELIDEWLQERTLGVAITNNEDLTELLKKWEFESGGKVLNIEF